MIHTPPPAPGVTVSVAPDRATIAVDRPQQAVRFANLILPLVVCVIGGAWGWSIVRHARGAPRLPWHLLPQLLFYGLLLLFARSLLYGLIAGATQRMTFVVTAGYLEIATQYVVLRRRSHSFSYPRSQIERILIEPAPDADDAARGLPRLQIRLESGRHVTLLRGRSAGQIRAIADALNEALAQVPPLAIPVEAASAGEEPVLPYAEGATVRSTSIDIRRDAQGVVLTIPIRPTDDIPLPGLLGASPALGLLLAAAIVLGTVRVTPGIWKALGCWVIPAFFATVLGCITVVVVVVNRVFLGPRVTILVSPTELLIDGPWRHRGRRAYRREQVTSVAIGDLVEKSNRRKVVRITTNRTHTDLAHDRDRDEQERIVAALRAALGLSQ